MMVKYEPRLITVWANPPLNCVSVSHAFHSLSSSDLLSSIFSLPPCIPSYLALIFWLFLSVHLSVWDTHTHTHKYSPSHTNMHTRRIQSPAASPAHITASRPCRHHNLWCSSLFRLISAHLATVWFLPNHYFVNCFHIIIAVTQVFSHTYHSFTYFCSLFWTNPWNLNEPSPHRPRFQSTFADCYYDRKLRRLVLCGVIGSADMKSALIWSQPHHSDPQCTHAALVSGKQDIGKPVV